MDTPDVSSGSSPAPSSSPAPISGEAALNSLSSEDRATWFQTGELPERIAIASKGDSAPTSDVPAASSPAPTTPADSSPAAPANPAASTDATAAPASEPGTPPKKGGHKGNAETRVQELLASERRYREDIARLQGQIDALTRGPAKPDVRPGSSPETPPTQAEYKRYLAMPDAPKEADFETYAEFSAALGVFITDQRWQEHQQRAGAETRVQGEVQRVRQTSERAQARIQDFQKGDPEFVSKVNPALLEIEPVSVRRLSGQPIGPQHVLAEEILSSPVTPQLLMHFSTEEGQQDWSRLMALPPSELLRAFGRLEARFDAATPSAPAPKTVSSAPAPPMTLGTRTADTADPLEAAIKRRDTAAYIREANKRDLAAMGL